MLTPVLLATAILALLHTASTQLTTPDIPGNIVTSHAQNVLGEAGGHTLCDHACATIASILPGGIYLGVQGDFIAHLWDTKQSDLIPACRVEPATAEEVRDILKVLEDAKCHFAIRSGGHSRIPGSSNANRGVTIDLSRMNVVKISNDKSSIRIGAGAVWGQVYRELEEHGLMVAGGRVEDVGTCDQVLEFEVVLPNATIEHVTQSSNPELYWAVRGGGNNFGVVTSFLFQAFEQKPEIWRANVMYDISNLDALLDAQHDFVTRQQLGDPDAVAFFPYGWVQEYNLTVAVFLFMHANHQDPDTWPSAFSRFEKVPRVEQASNIGSRKISDLTADIRGSNPHSMRTVYKTVTYKASREMDAAVFSAYLDVVEPLKTMNPSFLAPFVIFHPTPPGHTKPMLQRGGNPLGLANEGPLTIMQTSWMWKDSSDDLINVEANRDLFNRIRSEGKRLGVLKDYVYQNYAWEDQNMFESYGTENLERLQSIQRRVDPKGVFAKGGLCGGYFKVNEKVANAESVRDEL